MFEVTFDPPNGWKSAALTLTFIGCPENGIPAIDWRKDRGISPALPTNRVELAFRLQSEKIVRSLPPSCVDSNADVNAYTFSRGIGFCQAAPVSLAVPWCLPVDHTKIAPMLADPANEDAIILALLHVIDRFHVFQSEKEEAEKHDREEKEAEARASLKAKEDAILAEARAGKLYRQGAKGIARVTDLM